MGLIRNAEIKKSYNPESIKSKKKNGLLDRIVSLSPYDTLKRLFLDVLSEAHCDKGFLLYPAGDRYQVVLENGFDLTSSTRMMPELSSLMHYAVPQMSSVFPEEIYSCFHHFFLPGNARAWSSLRFIPFPSGKIPRTYCSLSQTSQWNAHLFLRNQLLLRSVQCNTFLKEIKPSLQRFLPWIILFHIQ